MSFEKLNNNTISACEDKITEYWKSINILDKSIKSRSNDNKWVFYDGPATANGNPGLHHMLAKFLKDAFCKYKTMCGKQVYRKIGWDTHGLPVEVKVEKDLGFNGIWLMPIHPSPTYHKYDVKDYYNVDPKYGSMEDLEELIDECHERNIKLIIDILR